MKTLLIVFLFIVSLVSIQAQNKISYAYDAAGNRTERIIVLATKSAEAKTETFFTEELAERTIKIYPNPTDGFLKVEIGNTEGIKNCTITITAMNTGKQIKKQKATLPVTDIDISNQPFGVYVMLIDIDGQYTSWKIIKK
ncbi:MAG: T9SS type A sorting domain-containing protein [Prevotella sp.]|jgi:hypothetical protein|nr:T9SS type A sorting domain-containing protein [Prevotella sp.]